MADGGDEQEAHILAGVDAIASILEQQQRSVSRHEHGMETLSRVLSRPQTFYVVCTACCMWIGANVAAQTIGLHALDPAPFFFLQSAICFGALITALAVSASQRRQGLLAEQRSHLDLQINLLAEKKLAKIIALIEELRRDSPEVKDRADPEAAAMSSPADPALVAEVLDSKSHE